MISSQPESDSQKAQYQRPSPSGSLRSRKATGDRARILRMMTLAVFRLGLPPNAPCGTLDAICLQEGRLQALTRARTPAAPTTRRSVCSGSAPEGRPGSIADGQCCLSSPGLHSSPPFAAQLSTMRAGNGEAARGGASVAGSRRPQRKRTAAGMSEGPGRRGRKGGRERNI